MILYTVSFLFQNSGPVATFQIMENDILPATYIFFLFHLTQTDCSLLFHERKRERDIEKKRQICKKSQENI